MSSVLPGFEYDIFISYRQKDNKGDGWVTEFVEALKTELEATFKEDISVYFDINPHDGLLETHDVDASLKSKLKCLVFIPIISRTYCDPKSFAWEQEFKAFVDQASNDRLGLKVKLPNGNLTTRVLPIRINDLDGIDSKLFESVLGKILRSIDFIYITAGVNRPLRPKEDNPGNNLNKTFYRDQVNKAALAIRDIISGLKIETRELPPGQKENQSILNQVIIPEKSIIVLPFDNMSPDPDQEYFSDGLTEEIITDLSHVNDLLVISRSSAMTFKGTKKRIRDIAEEVNVHYVLEGSVRKAGNNLRITAQLIDGITDTHLWAEKYNGTMDDVFDIQEKVSRSIVDSLMIKLSPAENKQMAERPIENALAYEYYLKANREMQRVNEVSLEGALKDFHTGLEIVGNNALIYAGIGTVYCNFYEFGIRATEEVLIKAEKYAFRVLELAPNSSLSYSLLGRIERFRGNALRAIKYFRQALNINPHDPEAQFWLVIDYSLKVGRLDLVKPILKQLMDRDPLSPLIYLASGCFHILELNIDQALKAFNKMAELDPDSVLPNFWSTYALLWNKQYDRAFDRINNLPSLESADQVYQIFNGWLLFLKFALNGEKSKATEFLTEDLLGFFWNDPDFPWLGAGGYALIEEREESLRWLEHCINKGNINYPLLSQIDPFLENIRGEKRYQELMERIRLEWENFEA